MKKQTIKLKESQLRQLIHESIMIVLSEGYSAYNANRLTRGGMKDVIQNGCIIISNHSNLIPTTPITEVNHFGFFMLLWCHPSQ